MINLEKDSDNQPTQEEIDQYIQQVYDYAADLIVNKGLSYSDAKRNLINQGIDPEGAETVVNNIEQQIDEAKHDAAGKDIMWGLIWTGGGLALTFITGGQYIFWGAVVYGGYRFIKGLANQ